MSVPPRVRATVVYATPAGVWEREVSVAAGSTLADAVAASGVLDEYLELRQGAVDLGVYSRPRPGSEPLRNGDRVEIYRPLRVDPKEARRVRAEVRRRRKGR